MKKLTILLIIILCVFPAGCSKKTAQTESIASSSQSNSIEENVISRDEALYIVKSEYDGTLPDGGENRFTYLRTEEKSGLDYYVFSWTVTDERGASVSENPEIWVAADGSHTTTEAALAVTEEEQASGTEPSSPDYEPEATSDPPEPSEATEYYDNIEEP